MGGEYVVLEASSGFAPAFFDDGAFDVMDFLQLFGLGSGIGVAAGSLFSMFNWALVRSLRVFYSVLRDGYDDPIYYRGR